MTIVDLSHNLSPEFPAFPGDPVAKFEKIAEIDRAGFNDTLIHCTTHISTHIDAPYHMLENGKKINEFEASDFVGEGVLVDCRDIEKLDENVLKNVSLKKGDIVLFWTGHDRYLKNEWQQTYFDEFPKFAPSLAKALAQAGVKMIGMDTPSPDLDPFESHKILFQNNCLIIENLTNLEALEGKKFTVAALPLKVPLDGAPARVVAILE